MKKNEMGTTIVDCAEELHRNPGRGLLETVYEADLGEALMRDGITRAINGYLDCEPPCLGAFVKKEFIEQSAGANGLPPVAQPWRSASCGRQSASILGIGEFGSCT